MVDEERMTKKRVMLAKRKAALLEKFGMVNPAVNLRQRIDTSYDVEKAVAKGYSVISLKDGSLQKRLCPPQVVGKKTVVVGQKEVGFFTRKTKDITEECDETQIPVLENMPLENWHKEISLAVLQKVNKAKKDGFKRFRVYYPQEGGCHSFSCNDPVVVGYISQGKYKDCNEYDYNGALTRPCTDKRLCARSHWTYFPIGPAFEIAAWDQCDVDKEGI